MKNVNDLFQKLIKGCDRTPLIQRLMNRHGWSHAQAEIATVRYWLFLCVAALNVNITLVPTQEIDCVWEEHILTNTEEYVQICHQLCGGMINHADENSLRQTHDFKDITTAFEQTQTLLEFHVGLSFFGDSFYHAAACGRPGISTK